MRLIGAPSLGVVDENASKAATSQKNVTCTQRPKVPRGSGIRYKEKTSADEGKWDTVAFLVEEQHLSLQIPYSGMTRERVGVHTNGAMDEQNLHAASTV